MKKIIFFMFMILIISCNTNNKIITTNFANIEVNLSALELWKEAITSDSEFTKGKITQFNNDIKQFFRLNYPTWNPPLSIKLPSYGNGIIDDLSLKYRIESLGIAVIDKRILTKKIEISKDGKVQLKSTLKLFFYIVEYKKIKSLVLYKTEQIDNTTTSKYFSIPYQIYWCSVNEKQIEPSFNWQVNYFKDNISGHLPFKLTDISFKNQKFSYDTTSMVKAIQEQTLKGYQIKYE